MAEISNVGPTPQSNENGLSFDDAWLVAHDPDVKRSIEKAIAGRSVAKKLVVAIEEGHSALPEIQLKGQLARKALGRLDVRDRYYGDPADEGETNSRKSLMAKWKLRKEKNIQMLSDEDDVVYEASRDFSAYSDIHHIESPYHTHNREGMSPEKIREAEIALAHLAVITAEEQEQKIEDRTQDIVSAKAGTYEPSNEELESNKLSNRALAQLESVKGYLREKSEAPTDGMRWTRYVPGRIISSKVADPGTSTPDYTDDNFDKWHTITTGDGDAEEI